jgi:acetyl esterase
MGVGFMSLTGQEKVRLAKLVRETNVVEVTMPDDYIGYLEEAECEESWINTSEGKTHIFIVKSKNREKNCPVYINFHGGGFARPYGKRNTVFCARVASAMKGIAIDVDYKLAPEYPFPAAFNEAYDVAKWVFKNIELLGGDPNRVSMGGDSAGGNLTAAVALKANQTKEFRLRMQIIIYGAMDFVTDPADKPEARVNLIPIERCRAFTSLYTDDIEEVVKSPYVSMRFAPIEMLYGLPDALLITAGHDNFRFEAEEYASRMISAGVKVTAKRFLNSNHGFVINCNAEWEEAQQLIINTLKSASL